MKGQEMAFKGRGGGGQGRGRCRVGESGARQNVGTFGGKGVGGGSDGRGRGGGGQGRSRCHIGESRARQSGGRGGGGQGQGRCHIGGVVAKEINWGRVVRKGNRAKAGTRCRRLKYRTKEVWARPNRRSFSEHSSDTSYICDVEQCASPSKKARAPHNGGATCVG